MRRRNATKRNGCETRKPAPKLRRQPSRLEFTAKLRNELHTRHYPFPGPGQANPTRITSVKVAGVFFTHEFVAILAGVTFAAWAIIITYRRKSA